MISHLVLICIYRLMNSTEPLFIEFRSLRLCYCFCELSVYILGPLYRYPAQKSLFKETPDSRGQARFGSHGSSSAC